MNKDLFSEVEEVDISDLSYDVKNLDDICSICELLRGKIGCIDIFSNCVIEDRRRFMIRRYR